jgi:hypothetical protein
MYMYMNTCTYTDYHASMYIHLHISTCIYIWACMHMLQYVHEQMFVQASKYIDMVTNIYSLDRNMNIYIYIYIYILIYKISSLIKRNMEQSEI